MSFDEISRETLAKNLTIKQLENEVQKLMLDLTNRNNEIEALRKQVNEVS